jgi:hypothetical protein
LLRAGTFLTQSPLLARCISAPCEADVGVYELVGEVGKKNGEKRLRCARARRPARVSTR